MKPIFGMIHIQPTPGSPNFRTNDSISHIKSDAIVQAHRLLDCKVDGLIIENMHDRPFNLQKECNPITISLLAIIGNSIRNLYPTVPIGVQILTAANHEALSVASAADLDFIRCEGFVYGHVADEGWIQSCAPSLMRYRKQIQAEHIWVMVDVKKKHSSHSITSDLSLLETINSAEFFLADSVIITGSFTGIAPCVNELKQLKNNGKIHIPVALGSGIDVENIERYFDLADLFIVGSHFKKDGIWSNALETGRISNFMSKVIELRNLSTN